ncbi:MAG: DNA polymerase I, partial [Pseudomonadota bacterium]
KHLYLVDGSAYIFRAYHKLPPLTRKDGTPVNAVFGFTTMLFKLLQDVGEGDKPSHFAVILDAAKESFRNDIYADYKANRPPPPDDLVPQFPLIREAVKGFSVPCIEMLGFEADDIIATYARRAAADGFKVTIVSSDKDLMQLIDDQVSMFDTMKNVRLGHDAVLEKFGVEPERVVDVQALAGDSVDNVPGVPGIGIKTAAQLINEYGDLDTLLDRAGEIKKNKRRENLIEFADQARLSRDLVRLKQDVDLELGLDDLTVRPQEPAPLLAFLDDQGFHSLKAKMLADQPEARAHEAGSPESNGDNAPIDRSAYECVTTWEAFDDWIARARDRFELTIDTETTSLDPMEAELVGIALALGPGEACYIPLAHTGSDGDGLALDGAAPEQLPRDEVLDRLKPLLNDPAVLKIGQNLKYDMAVLANYDVKLTPIADTMLISYALDAGRGGHGMDDLAERHLAHKTIAFKDIAGTGKKQLTFDKIPLEDAVPYAAEDADVTARLYRLLKPRLAQEHVTRVYERLERPLAPVLVDMERAGIKVDRQVLSRLSGEFAQRMGALEADIHELAGEPFNIGSPKQMSEILFEKLDLEPKPKKTKTGAYATGAEILEKLAETGHELPRRILEWRQLAKLKSTYADALQNQINPQTGRVHTSYHMASTSTGRLSSNDPNLQNIPIRTEEGRRIRQAFVPEPGHVLIAADYSQIELRLLAHIADMESLKTAFAEGQDIHAMTASEVFDVPIEGMDPIVRRRAKAINFGIIYGISAFGLARQLDISRGDAKRYIDTYFERFPGIRTYMDEQIALCRKQGYVETLFGRRAHFQNINSKDQARRGFSERAAINAPIQGSAADIIRRAMIRMPGALAEAGLSDVKMLLQVHDELVFEAPEDRVDAAIPIIRDVMADAAAPAVTIDVPLVIDCGTGQHWDEAH